MALEEYKRKRDFGRTPEPGPKVEKQAEHRFVVQKHHASHLHFDFRLEMDGVLKSWAVPKGPPLDPGEKRLAMMVEDHPVSYFHFEGIIPEGNYGAGTVMVWDTGTWEPLSDAKAMLEKGDVKFRLHGKKLNGEFVLARMRSKRPGSKGNEWLLIKKQDAHVVEGFNANDPEHDWSVLTKRSMAEIRGDKGSVEWKSSRPAAPSKKSSWLAGSMEKKSTRDTKVAKAASAKGQQGDSSDSQSKRAIRTKAKDSFVSSVPLVVKNLKGTVKVPMPRTVTPMMATLVDKAFDEEDWLFEVKWDGYRAIAFVDVGKLRLVSRRQNELTFDFVELSNLPKHITAKQAILDGEICVLDDEGRPSFSLMQQRTGFEPGRMKRRTATGEYPIVYYAFDLLYLDGYSLFRVNLEDRKELLKQVLKADETYRYSDHVLKNGLALYKAAQEKGLEGIVAKRRFGHYVQKRSPEWLKIKLTQRQECVIGGYTDPRGARENFGSLVLGLYDDIGQLIPVGQAGSGFTQKTHADMWKRLKLLQTDKSPFATKPDSPRGLHYIKPELVAEIKFTEWTHEGPKSGPKSKTAGSKGSGLKMRAPVFQGLRFDKKPEECRFEPKKSAREEAKKAERGDAA